ncbi:GNAT family N-acetyltransferase [Membranicola marinus]|uniref:GNAT family N-acetyltransferase n=1 Tax=Membranihabitans marinus TaxID=1227546 RepID=A0A953I0Y3_9BACT|nr:GNAT family N-acetyltransferase [Membranihabitans marinus]MBY5959267.1 GNAT family N-acetyltransferase [Membranihabitans marinus]
MKLIFSEYVKDYDSYTFSYAPYVVFQNRNKMTETYEAGFLPYTGNLELDHFLYYKARSLRVNLAKFGMGSENRRVARKFEDFDVSVNWIPLEEFNVQSADFLNFCLRYSRERFRGGEMSKARLEYVLQSPFLTHLIIFEIAGKTAGYVLSSQNKEIIHYWYSFFELEDFQDLPLGKYMMLEVIRRSKEKGLRYCYLGTCYGAHSLYKVRDFKGVEFSDGNVWSSDVKKLKAWCKNDDQKLEMDRLKQMTPPDANAYLDRIIN